MFKRRGRSSKSPWFSDRDDNSPPVSDKNNGKTELFVIVKHDTHYGRPYHSKVVRVHDWWSRTRSLWLRLSIGVREWRSLWSRFTIGDWEWRSLWSKTRLMIENTIAIDEKKIHYRKCRSLWSRISTVDWWWRTSTNRLRIVIGNWELEKAGKEWGIIHSHLHQEVNSFSRLRGKIWRIS